VFLKKVIHHLINMLQGLLMDSLRANKQSQNLSFSILDLMKNILNHQSQRRKTKEKEDRKHHHRHHQNPKHLKKNNTKKENQKKKYKIMKYKMMKLHNKNHKKNLKKRSRMKNIIHSQIILSNHLKILRKILICLLFIQSIVKRMLFNNS